MRVALIPGHGSKPSGFDPGAVYGPREEWIAALQMATGAAQTLRQKGRSYEPIVLTVGGYLGRRQYAEQTVGDIECAVHLHLDAAGYRGGYYIHDERSPGGAGERLARAIGRWVKSQDLDTLPDPQVRAVGVEEAEEWLQNAASLVCPWACPTVLVEPAPVSLPLSATDYHKIGGWIGQGIHQWIVERES